MAAGLLSARKTLDESSCPAGAPCVRVRLCVSLCLCHGACAVVCLSVSASCDSAGLCHHATARR